MHGAIPSSSSCLKKEDYYEFARECWKSNTKLRKAKGWTQEQLAEAAGLHYSYIGGIERGDRNISLETLEKIITGLYKFSFTQPPK